MNNNIFKRILTGILFVFILSAGILLSSYSFLIIFSIIVSVALKEFYSLIANTGRATVNKTVHSFGGFLLLAGTFMFVSETFGFISFFPYIFYLLYVFVSELYLKQQDPLQNWAYALLGQVYIAFPFAMLCLLPFQQNGSTVEYHPVLPFAFFVFIWINDSAAYVVGSAFGRRRLFERISPKKSWEGFLGGLLMTIITSLLFAYNFPAEMSVYVWIGMALVVVVFGTWGDLTESLMKRTIGVKDSGAMLPGHGGILDRFDSILLASPACAVYLFLLN